MQFSHIDGLMDNGVVAASLDKVRLAQRLVGILDVLRQIPSYLNDDQPEADVNHGSMMGLAEQGLGIDEGLEGLLDAEHVELMRKFEQEVFSPRCQEVRARLHSVVVEDARARASKLLEGLADVFGQETVRQVSFNDAGILEKLSKFYIDGAVYKGLMDFAAECGDSPLAEQVSFISKLMPRA